MEAQSAEGFTYVLTFLSVSLIALVHTFTPRLRFMANTDAVWVAAFAGVAVSYVFVDIMPKLATSHQILAGAHRPRWLSYILRHSYALAMLGFITFYGVHLAKAAVAKSYSTKELGIVEAPASI